MTSTRFWISPSAAKRTIQEAAGLVGESRFTMTEGSFALDDRPE